MGDLTAVEHVQRQIRANRKPRTALLAEVFGRGEHSVTVGPASPCFTLFVVMFNAVTYTLL